VRTFSARIERVRSILAIAALVAGLAVVSLLRPQPLYSQGQGYTFALIGDLGYAPSEDPWFENVLAEIGRDSGLAFVVHLGDLSSASRGCTDDMQSKRLAQFNAFPHPLIYTPGDNEWTDCHEGQKVTGHDPLERLERLRKLFFQGEHSLGQRKIPLVRQSQNPEFAKYRENARWDIGGVTFLTLHVVGSNDGVGRSADGDKEQAERSKANLAWLQHAFVHAGSVNSRAVMVILQANMFHEWPPGPKAMTPNPFGAVRAALTTAATAFKKPVVLVNGDSHYFRLDNPLWELRGKGKSPRPALENFMRLETFGSPNHHWVHVTVDPNDDNVFTVRPRIVAANVIKR
jgi:hypothetical protein